MCLVQLNFGMQLFRSESFCILISSLKPLKFYKNLILLAILYEWETHILLKKKTGWRISETNCGGEYVDLEEIKEQKNLEMTQDKLQNWYCLHHIEVITFKLDYLYGKR